MVFKFIIVFINPTKDKSQEFFGAASSLLPY